MTCFALTLCVPRIIQDQSRQPMNSTVVHYSVVSWMFFPAINSIFSVQSTKEVPGTGK